MLDDLPSPTVSRRFTLAEQAAALGVVLRQEFGVPFAFYRATSGQAVPDRVPSGPEARRLSTAELSKPLLPPDEVIRLAADNQLEVTILAEGRYQLTIVFYDGNKPLVVGAGLFVGVAKNRVDSEREQQWLQQWVQSVSDRLRQTEQLQRLRARADQPSQAPTA